MRGDVATATVYYQEAISRTDVAPGIMTGSPPLPEEVVSAFARFKLMVVHALSGDDTRLSAVYQELQTSVPEKSGARVYVAMAQAFWEAYQAGQGVQKACTAATEVAALDSSAVENLYAGYAKFAGYASTRYEKPEDLCRVP